MLVGYGPGVGHGVATAFARRGSPLLLCCRRPERHQALIADLEQLGSDVAVAAVDASDPEGLALALLSAVSTCPSAPLVLVYNAVASTAALPSVLSPARLAADLQVDTVAALAAAQAVLPLVRLRGGALLFTGGGMAHHPVAALASIGIGKAALRALMLCLGQELAASASPQDQGPTMGVGMVTIMGQVAAGTPFDPGAIGEAFVALQQRLALGEPGPLEVLFQG